ncbi:MAG: hypothetical protein Q8P80_00235 [Candidatus Levybacteria bacterium]|nr:hypothetical protein [Candidatus Levybacteria bacterium]
MKKKQIIIAGPCAAESEVQIRISLKEAKKRKVDFVRICLWKPRTKPGFDGLGEKAVNLLIEAAKMGLNPATEVLIPSQAEFVIKKVLGAVPKAKLLLWIGARNQNHCIQRDIAKACAKDMRVYLMIKNQPWVSEDHWEGIVGHVLHGGMSKDRIIVCHRGFTPNGVNPHGFRNMPDYEMAIRMKAKTGLPILFDPSHVGGTVENVLKTAKDAAKYGFDGLVIEVHHDPKNALTDAKQQLTWSEFDKLMSTVS